MGRTMTEQKTPWIEKAIAWISPEWAYERQKYRSALYDAGATDRLSGGWMPPSSATAEATAGPYRDRIRGRARDLENNDDLIIGALGCLERNVVGTGIRPQANVKRASGDQNERMNKALEANWETWQEAENCDLTRQLTFYEMQGLTLRRKVADGEIFIRRVTPAVVSPGKIPLKLQVLEADLLDTTLTKNKDNGNSIYGGVEVDQFGASVAYWFRPANQDDFPLGKSVRVDAKDIIHLFKKTRGVQFRGVSELVATVQRSRHSKETVDAEVMAMRLAACTAGFVTTNNPTGASYGRKTIVNGERFETIEPGMIHYLGEKENISFSNPGRPNTSIKEFLSLVERRVGLALGLSYEAVSRDLQKGSYSSARQGYLEDRRGYKAAQQYLVAHFCRPVWGWFVEACYLAEKLNAPDYATNPEKYTSVRWISPGWEWIDPEKEVGANSNAIASGQKTLEEVCGERGKDWREVLEQRAREEEYAASLGLTLRFGSSGSAGGQSQEEGGDNEEDADQGGNG
jgi:lambda family phage portal protein